MRRLKPVLVSSLDIRGRTVAVAQENTNNYFKITGSNGNVKKGEDTERMN